MAKKNVNISGGEAKIQKIIALREPGKGEKMLVKKSYSPSYFAYRFVPHLKT